MGFAFFFRYLFIKFHCRAASMLSLSSVPQAIEPPEESRGFTPRDSLPTSQRSHGGTGVTWPTPTSTACLIIHANPISARLGLVAPDSVGGEILHFLDVITSSDAAASDVHCTAEMTLLRLRADIFFHLRSADFPSVRVRAPSSCPRVSQAGL